MGMYKHSVTGLVQYIPDETIAGYPEGLFIKVEGEALEEARARALREAGEQKAEVDDEGEPLTPEEVENLNKALAEGTKKGKK